MICHGASNKSGVVNPNTRYTSGLRDNVIFAMHLNIMCLRRTGNMEGFPALSILSNPQSNTDGFGCYCDDDPDVGNG